MIRCFLAEATQKKDYLGGLVDFTEFLMHLTEHVSFSKVCNFQHDGSIECPLVIPVVNLPKGTHTSLQHGFDYTLGLNKIVMTTAPSALFVRVRPDFGLPPSALPQMSLNVAKSSYNLSAIVCIERSHYVVFLYFLNEWFFFDSMHGFNNGHCIPTMTHIPGFQAYIESRCNESLLQLKSDARDGETRRSFHDRVTKDSYTYLFTKIPESASSDAASAGGGAAVAKQQAHKDEFKKSPKSALSPAPPPQKPSAGGGRTAAIQHQAPPSFGYMQSPQGPQSFMDRLQSLFPALVIFHLFSTPVVHSGNYQPTTEDNETHMCLLASVRYDATVSGYTKCAFVYFDPNLTPDDVLKKNRLVTSFFIDKQPYRLTAVVYKDDHFVACPEIKSLPTGTRRDYLRQSFYDEINEYSSSTPNAVIDRMLFEPCI
jgi:hypothetical protein